jgi:hypothetical protein
MCPEQVLDLRSTVDRIETTKPTFNETQRPNLIELTSIHLSAWGQRLISNLEESVPLTNRYLAMERIQCLLSK